MTALSMHVDAAVSGPRRTRTASATGRRLDPPARAAVRPAPVDRVAGGPTGARSPAARLDADPVPPDSLRATVRGRRVLLAVVVVAAAGLGLLGGQAVAATPTTAPETVSVVVAPGDTLWELAVGLVEPGEDVRDVVLEIQRLNGLESAALRAGDDLLLPAA